MCMSKGLHPCPFTAPSWFLGLPENFLARANVCSFSVPLGQGCPNHGLWANFGPPEPPTWTTDSSVRFHPQPGSADIGYNGPAANPAHRIVLEACSGLLANEFGHPLRSVFDNVGPGWTSRSNRTSVDTLYPKWSVSTLWWFCFCNRPFFQGVQNGISFPFYPHKQ